MKEFPFLFGRRPPASILAKDLHMEHHHGDINDEDIALKLGFIIRDLQYKWISLDTYNSKKMTRVTRRVRATVQSLKQGAPTHSVALNAKVVRDLLSLTGAELISDEHFVNKLAANSKGEETDKDTSDPPITGTGSSTNASSIISPNPRESTSSITGVIGAGDSDSSSLYEDGSCDSELIKVKFHKFE